MMVADYSATVGKGQKRKDGRPHSSRRATWAVWKVETFQILSRNTRITSVHKTIETFLCFFYLHMGNDQGVVLHDSVSDFSCILAIVYFLGNSFLVQEA